MTMDILIKENHVLLVAHIFRGLIIILMQHGGEQADTVLEMELTFLHLD